MKMSKAYYISIQDTLSILKSAGCIEGELIDEDNSNDDGILFWNIACKNEKYSNKDLFITWNVIAVDKYSSADNKTFARDALIAIDIHTRLEIESTKVQNLIFRIDDESSKKDWELELSGASNLNGKSGLLSIPLNLVKKIK